MMRLRTTSPVSEAHTAHLCAACGRPIADSLSRLGSVRCHDCRDADVPIRAEVATETTGPRELAHRSAAGLDVFLLWFEAAGRVAIRVLDSRTGDRFELPVKPAEALNAFHHPFAYVRSRRSGAARAFDERSPAVEIA
jgi:hypothetical protein